MTDPIVKITGTEETHADSMMRGGIGFLGGLLLCGAALLAQVALLQDITGSNKKTS